MGWEILQVLMPFIWTKSLSMKLPIALESKSALTECISLVSVVLILIERMIDVLRASRVLAESCLGSLFSHFGFHGRTFLSGVEGWDVSIGSQISVLTSSMFNTVNLFTKSNQGILFTECTKQNPPPEQSILPFPLLHPSELSGLQSVPPFALQLTFRHSSSRDSSL